MQQALEALEALKWKGLPSFVEDATTALRQALAEPDQYAAQNPLGGPAKVFDAMADAIRAGDDYHATLRRYGFAEVKALAEPEQQPVAWMWKDGTVTADPDRADGTWTPLYTAPTPQHDTDCHLQGVCQRSGYSIANTPRKPLTDEERVNLVEFCGFLKYSAGYYEAICVTHSVEAAHGITGETK